MKIHDVKQNSDAWLDLRLGIPTASEFDRIVTPGGKLSKSETANRYMCVKLAEWALGAPLPSKETDFMRLGTEREPMARGAYSFETGNEVEEVGFVTTDDGMIGASPDGLLVTANRGLEIKCPAIQTHIRYMLAGSTIEDEYKVQVQGQIWVCEFEGVDSISYCPPLPNVISQIAPDAKFIGLLSTAVREFVDRLLEARQVLQTRYGVQPGNLFRDDANAEENAKAFDAFINETTVL